MGPNDQYENTWADGNGEGSEKFDYFDHLAMEKGGVNDAFAAAARNPYLPAKNGGDAEPSAFKFKGGYAFPQVRRTMGPNDAVEHCWGDCNGSGSEKHDYWMHLDEEVKHTGEDFWEHSAVPHLHSSNQKDAEPSGVTFQNGFTKADNPQWHDGIHGLAQKPAGKYYYVYE